MSSREFVVAALLAAVAGCAVGGGDAPSKRIREPQAVIGKTWEWAATITPAERITVANPERYTILFRADGTAQVRFDCNRGGGDYSISVGTVSFGPLLSTRMACPPDSLDRPFMRDLGRATSFFIQDGELFLELPMDSGTMRFRPVP